MPRDDAPRPGLTLEVQATDLDRDGCGLARWQGWVIVVPDLLPGEVAKIQLLQRQRSRWRSRRLDLIHRSEDRKRPTCILASDCGGCTLQHVAATGQQHWKERQLTETLSRLGGVSRSITQSHFNHQRSLGYRNRALIPLKREPKGSIRLGYYKRGSHRIINLNHCPVLDPRLDALIEPLKLDLDRAGWSADHDLRDDQGLRHLGLRVGHYSGDLLITLVSSHDRLKNLQTWATRWMDRWPNLRGVTLNLQPIRNNLILGKETRVIAGQDSIRETVCGLNLELDTSTFFQVNTPQAEAIITVICNWMKTVVGHGRILDAYCGIGTISLPLAAQGFEVVGIERHPTSINQAIQNAERNGLSKRCHFLHGDVDGLLASELSRCDAVVVDPPRRGLDQAVLNTLLACPPPYLAYLSCDPATQARDLKQLASHEGPYTTDELHPVDFFPQTSHLESLVLLRRVSCAVPR
jgi:23S rRNA (uracil1939-C5)-methyltransferase